MVMQSVKMMMEVYSLAPLDMMRKKMVKLYIQMETRIKGLGVLTKLTMENSLGSSRVPMKAGGIVKTKCMMKVVTHTLMVVSIKEIG